MSVRISLFFVVFLAISLLSSCGSNVEKGSLIGRTASIIDNNDAVFAYFKVDIQKIVTKSEAFGGALPSQYSAALKIYKDAIYKSIAVEKPIHILLEAQKSKEIPIAVIACFEVKDFHSLKKELTELGCAYQQQKHVEYFTRNNFSLAVSENFAVLRFHPKEKTSTEQLKKLINSSEHGVKNEKLAQILKAEDDVSFGLSLENLFLAIENTDEVSKSTLEKYRKDAEDAYILTQVNFDKGLLNIRSSFLFSDAFKKYLPIKAEPVSSEALHSIGNDSAIYAIAVNFDYPKIFNLVFDLLPQEQRNTIESQLALIGGKEKISHLFTGEFAASIGEMDSSTFTSRISGYASLDQSAYIKNLFSGFSGLIGLNPMNNDTYSNDNMSLKFTDKKIVFTTVQMDFQKNVLANSDGVKIPIDFPFGQQAVSVFMDISRIDTNSMSILEKTLLQNLSTLTISGDAEEIQIQLMAKNAEENLLKSLLQDLAKEIQQTN
jgi:hypothetical protein